MFKNEKDTRSGPNAVDYKAIYRTTGLTPAEFNRLQDLYHLEVQNRRFCEHQVEIYSCSCRSVWCEHCAVRSPTNTRVRDALRVLTWQKTRHIILTLGRETPAGIQMELIRRRRSVAKLMKALDCKKWVWILEFHADGFPHWHCLAESPHGHMIGKRKIQRLWRYGNVWESYIYNGDHWRAIIGYHRKKGYLAGEKKAHQLVLPPYLMNDTTVRKFGRPPAARAYTRTRARDALTAQTGPEPGVSRETCPERPKRPNRPYTARFAKCNTETSICLDNNRWVKIQGSLQETRDLFSDELERLSYKTFNVQSPEKYGQLLKYLHAFAINVNDKDPHNQKPDIDK